LELNENNKFRNYPLLEAISKNNIEIVKLIIEYANQHHIILKYDKNINKNNNYKFLIKKLLKVYKKEKEVKINK